MWKESSVELTCIDSCTGTDPEEAEYISPETLTGLLRIVIWECNRAYFSVGRPIVHQPCSLASHISPFTVFHPAGFVTFDQLCEAMHLNMVKGIVLPVGIDNRL